MTGPDLISRARRYCSVSNDATALAALEADGKTPDMNGWYLAQALGTLQAITLELIYCIERDQNQGAAARSMYHAGFTDGWDAASAAYLNEAGTPIGTGAPGA
jgi:hypothetical protein